MPHIHRVQVHKLPRHALKFTSPVQPWELEELPIEALTASLEDAGKTVTAQRAGKREGGVMRIMIAGCRFDDDGSMQRYNGGKGACTCGICWTCLQQL